MTSLQCVEAFSPAQPGEEQNHKGYGPQSGQYLHSWGGVVTFVLSMASKEDGESYGFLSIIKKKKKVPFCFPLLFGFLFVGSIYIKKEPIIALIEQDSGHNMGFGFENLISKMVREKLFFNMLLLILFLLWLI